MKTKPSKFLEQHRVTTGSYGSDETYGNNGAFGIPSGGITLHVIASDGGGWDHVSVHGAWGDLPAENVTPAWDQMCYVKSLFFRGDEWVVQYHPAESKYKNVHPHTLHLWRSQTAVMPTPPLEFV